MGGMTQAMKSPEELKEDLDGKDEASEDKYEKIASDPKMQPEYEFEIDYTDNRGKRWHGTFVNRILTYRMRTQVGTIRAQMNGGLPMEALDLNTLDMTEKVAHLTVSLGKRPPWAMGEKLSNLHDPQILDRIYAEVALHEATFRGSGEDQGTGQAGA
jgi:hypothetical protein